MLKRALFLTIGLLLLGATLSAAATNGRIKIAILDFQQNGTFETPDVGKMVAEWFTTSLVETGRFDIIERRLLQQILNEQKIGGSGIVESASASRIGKILGVKTVVTGTVQSFDGRLEVNARVINVETGSIISAEKVQADSATRVTLLVKEVSAKIMRAFPLEGHVVKRDKERVIIDLGKQAGVRPGMSFSVYSVTPIQDPDTGETIDEERVESGVVVIREVREKTADGRVTRESGAGAIKIKQQVRVQGEPQPEPQEEPPAPPALQLPVPDDPPEPTLFGAPGFGSRAPGPSPDDSALPANVLYSHTGDIKAITFSSSGKLVASADKADVIILWDARSWQPTAVLRGHTDDVKAVRFSRDERYLASGSRDEMVIVWDVRQKRELWRYKVGHTVNAVAFSPDNRLLATGSNSRYVDLFDLRSGALVGTFKGRDDVFALAFSPDAKTLAAAGNNRLLQLWEVESGRLIRDFEGHRRDVRDVTFNREGNLLISGSNDNKIIYWDVASGSAVKVLDGHEDSVRSLALSSDGSRLVSGDGHRQGGIIVWNAKNSQLLKRLDSQDDFDALALSPDGCTLLLGCNKNLVVRRIK